MRWFNRTLAGFRRNGAHRQFALSPLALTKSDDTASNAQKVEDFWDTHVGRHREPFSHWESPAPIKAGINLVVTGDAGVTPAEWFARRYGPFRRVADVGCGDGLLTHVLLAGDRSLIVDAYDISGISLDVARRRVEEAGLTDRATFSRIDLNVERLPERGYDAILSAGCAHHVAKLDFFFASMRRALAPGGYLWLNDYVGPNRFQWSDTQVRLANEFLAQVPSKWRLRDSVIRYTIDDVSGDDPSEAVAPQFIEEGLRAHFDVIERIPRGGTLLAPIFGSGCLSADMEASDEGRAVLEAMYSSEMEMVRTGVIPSCHAVYVARPRPVGEKVAGLHLLRRITPPPVAAAAGMSGPLPEWLEFNEKGAFQSAELLAWIAPFPPPDLMHRTTGLRDNRQFAAHGATILRALGSASPVPMNGFGKILDFGVGVGRVARIYKGFANRYVGVDIDREALAFVRDRLPWVETVENEAGAPLPDTLSDFDAVISISVFTHVDDATVRHYLRELHRVTRPGAILFLTFCGARVVERGLAQPEIASMIGASAERLQQALERIGEPGGFDFVEQYTHLTTETYRYGLMLVSEDYLRQNVNGFDVLAHVKGAIHDFQDLLVLKRRDIL